ncbi:tetratricopeptide repeat protein, partial [Candidatus Pacearchaeota archaeon]|nr:tetratricopeptide repeat protein [Candidatus Pacearchaeota archaeon]
MIETVNRSRSRQGCIKRACTTGKKLGLRLLFSLCVFSIGSELCSRCFWKLQGLSFFQCQKEIHLAFYPELKYVDALSIRRDDEYYDILLLGGSALHEAFGSIERLLGIRLELEKNKKVRLHNMAFRAHSTLDSYYKYRHLSDKRFDLVIVYHGINEVRANNCPPSLFREDYSHYSWYRAINSYEKASDSKLLIFPYTLTLTWIRGLDWLGLRRYVSTAKPNPSWIDYAGTIRTKEPFERNLARILELAEAKCEPVVLMSFSYYIPEEYPDVADWWMPIELWGKPEYVAKGIAVHNTVIEELARSHTHVMFIDQNKLVPKEKKFFRDICHFTGQGSERFVNNYLLARYMYAIEKRHNDAFAHYELANTLFRLERYTKAISHYHRSLQIEPNHAGAYVNLGRAVAAQGNLEQAISFFRQALHIQPYIGRGRGQIGTLLQLLGEFDRIHNPNCRKPRVVLNFVTVHRDL